MIEALRATTSVDELRTLAAVDTNEKGQLGTLHSQVPALEGNNQNVQLAGARSDDDYAFSQTLERASAA